jgi:hypothetical protein
VAGEYRLIVYGHGPGTEAADLARYRFNFNNDTKVITGRQ